ncbi:Semaphorin-5B [Liparis tanakae]|uniref:Semaphorin-5B n=1 Tax=Liparis tanakae TaxID=230148 RepID=A0A4Z2GIA9_9TELE|nr:Semaphorin-5B [Liparis tanakae]
MITSGWGAWALSPRGLVLVVCLSVCLSQQPHVRPADCGRKEHPVVQYQALRPWMSEFSHPGVKDFSQLALDQSRNQLIVGARNFLFRLSLNASLIQVTCTLTRCFNLIHISYCYHQKWITGFKMF